MEVTTKLNGKDAHWLLVENVNDGVAGKELTVTVTGPIIVVSVAAGPISLTL